MLTLGRSLEEEGWVVKAAGEEEEEEGAEDEAAEVEAGALAVAELNPLLLLNKRAIPRQVYFTCNYKSYVVRSRPLLKEFVDTSRKSLKVSTKISVFAHHRVLIEHRSPFFVQQNKT